MSDVFPAEGRRIACVGGIVRDPAGRWLLIRRGTEPGRGQWSIPGGRVEPGETLEAAVAREVLEETGVPVLVGERVGTVERDGRDGAIAVITDFVCTPRATDNGAMPEPLAGDDATEARWVNPAEMSSYNLVVGLLDALRDWGFAV